MRDVLEYNLTALSEESGTICSHSSTFAGELALSLLAKAISPQTRGDLEASNNQWRRVRLLYEARIVTNPKPAAGSLNRKFRLLVSIYHFVCILNLDKPHSHIYSLFDFSTSFYSTS